MYGKTIEEDSHTKTIAFDEGIQFSHVVFLGAIKFDTIGHRLKYFGDENGFSASSIRRLCIFIDPG